MPTLKLVSSRHEVSNVKSFTFECAEPITWESGQAMCLVLPGVGEAKADRERWFTISSSPRERKVMITTRISSSLFKQSLDQMKQGDLCEFYGLGGDFVWGDERERIMVAGGIGITPFRSMLVDRSLGGSPIQADLYYFSKDHVFPFRDELDQLANKTQLRVHYIDGAVDADRLPPSRGLFKRSPTIYLSGPEPMVETIGEAIRAKGLTVKQDWFPGYDADSY